MLHHEALFSRLEIDSPSRGRKLENGFDFTEDEKSLEIDSPSRGRKLCFAVPFLALFSVSFRN